jgi:hypothetical protein
MEVLVDFAEKSEKDDKKAIVDFIHKSETK